MAGGGVHAGAPRRRRDGWRRDTRWCAAEEARGLVEGYTLVRPGGGAMAGVWGVNDVYCTKECKVPRVGGTNGCMRYQSAGGTR